MSARDPDGQEFTMNMARYSSKDCWLGGDLFLCHGAGWHFRYSTLIFRRCFALSVIGGRVDS